MRGANRDRARVGRNAVWMFVGNAIFAACQWGVLMVLARLGGPELVGRFTVALAIVAPIIMFSRLAMRGVQAADATSRHAFSDYLAVRVATTIFALLVVSAIAVLAGYERETALAILALAVAKGVESLSDVVYGLELRHRRLDLISQSMVLRGISGLAALTVGLASTGSLLAGLLAMATGWAAVWLLFDVPMARSWWRATSRDRERRGRPRQLRDRAWLAWTALPLGITTALGSLNLNVPRYFVDGMLGTEAVGMFGVMAYFVVVGRLVVRPLSEAASPRLADQFAAGDIAAFRRLLTRLCLFGLLIGIAGLAVSVVAGRPILTLLYGPSFAAHSDLLTWIMMVGLMAYVVVPIGTALTMIHSFRSQPLMLGLAVAVNALGCYLLVPAYGLRGAALAWSCALLCQGLMGLGLIWHRLRRATCSDTSIDLPSPAP